MSIRRRDLLMGTALSLVLSLASAQARTIAGGPALGARCRHAADAGAAGPVAILHA